MKRTTQPLVGALLRHDASHARDGLYRAAIALALSTGAKSIPAMLRGMADRGPLAVADLLRVIDDRTNLDDDARARMIGEVARDEIAFLRLLLLAIADGCDIRDELRIDAPKIGHRGKSRLTAVAVAAVARMVADGNGSVSVASACEYVADATRLSVDAVSRAYSRGRSDQATLADRMDDAERAHAATNAKSRKRGQ